MCILSNRKGCSTRFLLDINSASDELISESESIDYNPNATEGTNIFISDLENNINKQIINSSCIDNILAQLGRRCSKFIKKRELVVFVNRRRVIAEDIGAKKIDSCEILGNYKVDLYKGGNGDISGIDLFINDYMIYNREKRKKEIQWNLLNEPKHTYTNCIVEIQYYEDESNFIKDKELLFSEVIKFIKKIKYTLKAKQLQFNMKCLYKRWRS